MRVAANNPGPGEGLAEGFRGRLVEFELFEKHFKECVSSAAILTKFEHHHSQGSEVVNELGLILEQEEQSIQKNRFINCSSLRWQPFLLGSTFSVSGRNTWTIVKRFDQFFSVPITLHWKVLRS